MAELYRARLGDRDIALKRPLGVYNEDEEFIVMLADEARVTALFDHPNIARTYEFGVVAGQYFLAMEYIEGVDLRAVLRRAGERRERVAPEVAAFVVEQALRGLHHAHEARDAEGRPLSLIHRDFSPSNIVLAYDGRVVLIDFGIAKARLNRARTQAGFIKGKVRYMSPEQTRSAPLDRRSDVFAAGVVLYYAATGRLPFGGGRGDEDAAVMEAVRTVEPPPPSAVAEGLDAGFDAVVAEALAKDREARFETAAAFADSLGAWRASRGGEAAADVAVAALVGRMFAQEHAESEALYRSFDDAAFERTPTAERPQYTRLVGGEAARSRAEALDAWLEARRRGEVWTADAPLDADTAPEVELFAEAEATEVETGSIDSSTTLEMDVIDG